MATVSPPLPTTVSIRMPAILRPSTSTSFGHLRPARPSTKAGQRAAHADAGQKRQRPELILQGARASDRQRLQPGAVEAASRGADPGAALSTPTRRLFERNDQGRGRRRLFLEGPLDQRLDEAVGRIDRVHQHEVARQARRPGQQFPGELVECLRSDPP